MLGLMPTSLSVDEHGDGIGDAWTVLRENARLAGLEAPVPTCPGWTTKDLVLHQGLVHRWAERVVRGVPMRDAGTIELPVGDEVLEREGFSDSDPFDWLDVGAVALLQALAFAPDDLDVPFFLRDAPPARFAWARRQCHETTIHAVDAMAARLGRPPGADEVWFGASLATDGIDELLTGFVPRRHQRLRAPTPWRVGLRATDSDRSWLLDISEEPVVTTAFAPGTELPDDLDSVLAGPAVPLYLALWNRGSGDALVSTGRDLLSAWRHDVRIT